MNFSTILKQLRDEHRISQAKLAEKIGVSLATVGMWESRKNTPTIETLNKLADYFCVSIDYLLGRENYSADKNIKIPEHIAQVNIGFKNVTNLTQAEIDEAERFILFTRQQREKENKGGDTK